MPTRNNVTAVNQYIYMHLNLTGPIYIYIHNITLNSKNK